MFKHLHCDTRRSTALYIMQHHTVGTYFSSPLDSLSGFFGQEICTVHILSFCLPFEPIGGLVLALGQALGWLVAFYTSSCLSSAFLTPTEKQLVVVFADGFFFSVCIPEHIHCKQQHWRGTKRCIGTTFATVFQQCNKIETDQRDLTPPMFAV